MAVFAHLSVSARGFPSYSPSTPSIALSQTSGTIVLPDSRCRSKDMAVG